MSFDCERLSESEKRQKANKGPMLGTSLDALPGVDGEPCPVTALGHRNGRFVRFSAPGELHKLSAAEHKDLDLMAGLTDQVMLAERVDRARLRAL